MSLTGAMDAVGGTALLLFNYQALSLLQSHRRIQLILIDAVFARIGKNKSFSVRNANQWSKCDNNGTQRNGSVLNLTNVAIGF